MKELGDMHYVMGNLSQAHQTLEAALKVYQSINSPRQQHVFYLLSAVSQASARFEEALQYGYRTVEAAKTTNDTADIGLFYGQVGLVHQDLKTTKKRWYFTTVRWHTTSSGNSTTLYWHTPRKSAKRCEK